MFGKYLLHCAFNEAEIESDPTWATSAQFTPTFVQPVRVSVSILGGHVSPSSWWQVFV
jgi:hypothetical protein